MSEYIVNGVAGIPISKPTYACGIVPSNSKVSVKNSLAISVVMSISPE